MDKFKEILKRKVKDETAAFAILTCMIITFFTTIGVNEFIRYNRIEQASSNLEIELSQSEQGDQTNTFSTLNEITSQEELKDLEEKEKDEGKEEEEKEQGKKNDKKEESTNKYNGKYYIKVNYGAQVVNIYTKDSKGNYTVPVKAMVCSTGINTPTSGVYTIGYRWEWLRMIGDVYGHYVTQICGDILFHSVPYLEKGNHSSLEWWAYDQLGTKASLGCVRLTTKDALWIYNNISYGTKVEFYSSSNPGPLGKPSAMKISNAPNNVKGWDPTDPDSRNPWPKYLESLEEANETKNEVVNEVIDTPVNDVVNEVIDDPVNDIVNDIVDNPVNDIANEVIEEPINDVVNDITNTPINDVANNEESPQVNSITNKDDNVNKTNTTTNDKVNNTTKDEIEKEPINDVSSAEQNELEDNVYVSELL